MNSLRFDEITGRYANLKVAVIGDVCLDRYLEIDPARAENSIETGLPVHNVTRVRSQPGAAGTVLNNLVALGVGAIYPVGVAGFDGEGWELIQALKAQPGVIADFVLQTRDRRTFTYTKPLVMEPGKPPVELNRLDMKNWTPTPPALEARLIQSLQELAEIVDAIILLEQVDLPDTGVITRGLLQAVQSVAARFPKLLIMADSRRGLAHFPAVTFKMNKTELGRFVGETEISSLAEAGKQALALARKNQKTVFVTLADQGIMGAEPAGDLIHLPSLPLRGEIDIVGAGDSVTANLTVALAAGAQTLEAVTLANAAASIVIHQLGTTGSATVPQLKTLCA